MQRNDIERIIDQYNQKIDLLEPDIDQLVVHMRKSIKSEKFTPLRDPFIKWFYNIRNRLIDIIHKKSWDDLPHFLKNISDEQNFIGDTYEEKMAFQNTIKLNMIWKIVIPLLSGYKDPHILIMIRELCLLVRQDDVYLHVENFALIFEAFENAVEKGDFLLVEVIASIMGSHDLISMVNHLKETERLTLTEFYCTHSNAEEKMSSPLAELSNAILKLPTLEHESNKVIELKRPESSKQDSWIKLMASIRHYTEETSLPRQKRIPAYQALNQAIQEKNRENIVKCIQIICKSEVDEECCLCVAYFFQVQLGNVELANNMVDLLEERKSTDLLDGFQDDTFNGWTSLFILAQNKTYSEAECKLLERHLNLCADSIRLKDKFGHTPLEKAIFSGNEEGIKPIYEKIPPKVYQEIFYHFSPFCQDLLRQKGIGLPPKQQHPWTVPSLSTFSRKELSLIQTSEQPSGKRLLPSG